MNPLHLVSTTLFSSRAFLYPIIVGITPKKLNPAAKYQTLCIPVVKSARPIVGPDPLEPIPLNTLSSMLFGTLADRSTTIAPRLNRIPMFAIVELVPAAIPRLDGGTEPKVMLRLGEENSPTPMPRRIIGIRSVK